MNGLTLVLWVAMGCASVTETVDSGDTSTYEPPWGEMDPFADAVVSFEPGEGAGFGQDSLPAIVLGAPEGGGAWGGGSDVLSLGNQGVIVLEFSDIVLQDGPGADLLVFENPFPGWLELGAVAVSENGEVWHEWPCDSSDEAGGYPGCAGVASVLANSENRFDPTDPVVAGGDAYDLADLGLSTARFVRIIDSGTSDYAGTSGGFDLDALAVVHWPDQVP